MKKLTKVLAVVLSALFVFGCFAACSNSGETENTESDLAYIQGKGKLVVGITDFAPMDYKDKNGEWIGFDADLGRKVAEKRIVLRPRSIHSCRFSLGLTQNNFKRKVPSSPICVYFT